jgi:hypothetical protein
MGKNNENNLRSLGNFTNDHLPSGQVIHGQSTLDDIEDQYLGIIIRISVEGKDCAVPEDETPVVGPGTKIRLH